MRQLVHGFLGETAARAPDEVALIEGARSVSFGALQSDSHRLASALQGLGVRRGDRVAVMMDNSIELLVAVFGILQAGAVFVLVDPGTRSPKLAWLLADSGARLLFTQERLRRVVEPALAEPCAIEDVIWRDADAEAEHRYEALLQAPPAPLADPGLIDADLCAVIYTSGSTGRPRGVMLTHRNMCNTAWSISTYLGNTPEDVIVCALPLSFDYGLYQVITAVRVGFSVVLERSFAYPRRVLEDMARHRVTGFPGVPTMFASVLGAPPADLDLSSLRYMTNTGAALPPAHIDRLRAMFPDAQLFSMYGLTECTRVSYLDPAQLDTRPASVGKAMPNSEAYVVDEAGRRAAPGEVGELVVRGANVMLGYWNRPDATAFRLREGPLPGEKLLYTGDRFRADEEGYLYFVARDDDLFKCRGHRVSPREIEDVLYAHEGVAEARVIGVPHAHDGEAIKAFVVPREGTTLGKDEVRRHCRAHLEPALQPRFVELREALERTATGKLSKRGLS